jgi:hypothetical protein
MNKGGKQTRLKLFDELATDLSRNVLGKHDLVWCPLCLNEFGREAAESGVLTEEHVIPESTTNHEVTLTCKSCNDKTGHQIDYQIGRKVKHDLAVKGGKSLKGKLKWEGGGTPADVTFKKNADIHLDLQRVTPHVTKSLIEKLAAHATGERPMRLRLVSPYRMDKYAAALVKSAYLGLFVDRGYGYILLPALEAIRRAILEDGGDRERLAEMVVACNLNACADLPQPPDRLSYVSPASRTRTDLAHTACLPKPPR